MKNIVLFTQFFILLFTNLCFSQESYKNDTLVIINDLSQYISEEKLTKEKLDEYTKRTKTTFQARFSKVKYISSANKSYVDSIYANAKKAIKIEERWYKTIQNTNCYPIANCWVWGLNRKISIKNISEATYFLQAENTDKLIEYILDFYNQKNTINLQINRKIFIEIQKGNHQEYVNNLKEEFGSKNVTIPKKRIFLPLEKVYTSVYLSFNLSDKKYIAEFVDSDTGQIVRTDKID